MIFATYWFLLAIVFFLPLYWLARKPAVRLAILIVFCFVFHTHFAGAAGVLPIVVLAVITFLIGSTRNRTACAIGIAICVFALCMYKYSYFFIHDVLEHANPGFAGGMNLLARTLLPATPPLAISFFTFEFVHYLYEVRRGRPSIDSPLDFIQFTFFFPSLVAGPIKRYEQFLPSIKEGLKHVSSNSVMLGLLQVAAGYFKKVFLADNLTLYINHQESFYNVLPLEARWLFVVALGLRIYFDFSGYSDIAIGLARTMGVELPANFNWPYIASDIRDFWQRWHISLSSWIRDYIYIPLGGSRKGALRRVLNGVFAFALCGLWHGPAWNFVLWGLYHGVGLALCASYRSFGKPGLWLAFAFDRIPGLGWLTTMLFVFLGWLLFFYPLDRALEMGALLFEVTG